MLRLNSAPLAQRSYLLSRRWVQLSTIWLPSIHMIVSISLPSSCRSCSAMGVCRCCYCRPSRGMKEETTGQVTTLISLISTLISLISTLVSLARWGPSQAGQAGGQGQLQHIGAWSLLTSSSRPGWTRSSLASSGGSMNSSQPLWQ